MKKGEILSEKQMVKRIMSAVMSIIDLGVEETIELHNHVCKGKVSIHESEGGEPLGVNGKVSDPETEAWTYLCTEGEDE